MVLLVTVSHRFGFIFVDSVSDVGGMSGGATFLKFIMLVYLRVWNQICRPAGPLHACFPIIRFVGC